MGCLCEKWKHTHKSSLGSMRKIRVLRFNPPRHLQGLPHVLLFVSAFTACVRLSSTLGDLFMGLPASVSPPLHPFYHCHRQVVILENRDLVILLSQLKTSVASLHLPEKLQKPQLCIVLNNAFLGEKKNLPEPFHKYLLSTYCMPETVRAPRV